MVPQLSALSLALCYEALVGGGNRKNISFIRYKQYVHIYSIRSIDPCLFTCLMGTNAYQTISTDRLRAGRNLVHSLCSFTIPANQSTLGARLSLIRYTQSRIVGSRLIAFSAPHRHVKGETPFPVFARSTPFAHLLPSITKSRLSLDAGGFTLHRFVPYRNHAYKKPM